MKSSTKRKAGEVRTAAQQHQQSHLIKYSRTSTATKSKTAASALPFLFQTTASSYTNRSTNTSILIWLTPHLQELTLTIYFFLIIPTLLLLALIIKMIAK